MKIVSSIVVAFVFLLGLTVSAQTNVPLFIKGNVGIKYNSRTAEKPVLGVSDLYDLNINVANSALFHGTITDTPQIIDGWVSKTVVQKRGLKYDVALDVVNPKILPVDPNNSKSVRNVGRMYGNVPILSDGTYDYNQGSLTVDILPMGNAGGFSSKFTGIAIGKPMNRPANWMDTVQRQTVNITRSINGKTMTVALKKYDKMEFRQHVISAGPVAIYQAVTVNGELYYDYDKSCWFFNNVTVQYADNGNVKIDRLTGTIRWVEPKRGNGEYQFDIRVNEPPPSATAAFETKASDESSFFETDTTVPAVSGTMKYADTLRGDTTLASNVTIDLNGSNITKQQLMVVAKLIIFSSVVPMNAD